MNSFVLAAVGGVPIGLSAVLLPTPQNHSGAGVSI
jgi:hypothetical protein